MSALDLDALEALARRCVTANAKIDAATNAYTRWDAQQEALAPHEDLGLHGAEVLALITRLRAAESDRTVWSNQRLRLEGELDDAIGRASLAECALAAARAKLPPAKASAAARECRLPSCSGGACRNPADCVSAAAEPPAAAEARTAWQPIETALVWPDRQAAPPWVLGQRVARPPVVVAQTAPGVFADEYGNRQHITAWAPLPAAPEAP